MIGSECVVDFIKMHGAGNDYVYILALDHVPDNLEQLARDISDRHFGVGGDGLVVICRSDVADFRMRMFNADGSEAQMCGNAIRCVGKLLYDKGISRKTEIAIETLAGVKILQLFIDSQNKVVRVRVDMGAPVLDPQKIPVSLNATSPILNAEIMVGQTVYKATPVGMGNPHGVIFTEKITDSMVLGDGPKLEVADFWPEKGNIEFVTVQSPSHITMRVWERGTGETLACGTGACASVVACILNGFTHRKVEVSLTGGILEVEWSEADNHVYLTGPAELVAEGKYYIRKKQCEV